MAAFLHCPLSFDIKECCINLDKPFHRLQTISQITYLAGYWLHLHLLDKPICLEWLVPHRVTGTQLFSPLLHTNQWCSVAIFLMLDAAVSVSMQRVQLQPLKEGSCMTVYCPTRASICAIQASYFTELDIEDINVASNNNVIKAASNDEPCVLN